MYIFNSIQSLYFRSEKSISMQVHRIYLVLFFTSIHVLMLKTTVTIYIGYLFNILINIALEAWSDFIWSLEVLQNNAASHWMIVPGLCLVNEGQWASMRQCEYMVDVYFGNDSLPIAWQILSAFRKGVI